MDQTRRLAKRTFAVILDPAMTTQKDFFSTRKNLTHQQQSRDNPICQLYTENCFSNSNSTDEMK
ncbi:CLUMA_CG007269, isoform A [Clunio marinus]|uniref:CLUMA_CG007269, isoform A n=1 Tax=Clunio marinus TaxID=568069 RepID=A0A1J1I0E5_9DIPT|nr:CLUMA_CG007269, isoform A [Clunio marinus]